MVCVISAALAVITAGGTGILMGKPASFPTQTAARPSAPPTSTPPVERLEIIGKPYMVTIGNSTQVSAIAWNKENLPRSAIILATFTDSGNKTVATAIGAVLNVLPNQGKPFTIISDSKVPENAKVHLSVQSRLPAAIQTSEASITFSNVTAKAAGSGYTIDGQATNKDSRPHKFTVVGTLLDQDGNIVGIGRAPAETLPAGGVINISITSTQPPPPFAQARMQVDVFEE